MSPLRKLLSSIWTITGALAVCVTLLVGFTDARDNLVEAIDTVSPIGAALVPFVAMFGIVVAGGLLATQAIRLLTDRLSDGPRKRALRDLHPAIRDCEQALLALPGQLNEYVPKDFADATVRGVNTELRILAQELDKLGIPRPPTVDVLSEAANSWLEFLTPLGFYARDGRLDDALGCYSGNPSRDDNPPDAS